MINDLYIFNYQLITGLTSARFRFCLQYVHVTLIVGYGKRSKRRLLKMSRNLRDYLSSWIFQNLPSLVYKFIGIHRKDMINVQISIFENLTNGCDMIDRF